MKETLSVLDLHGEKLSSYVAVHGYNLNLPIDAEIVFLMVAFEYPSELIEYDVRYHLNTTLTLLSCVGETREIGIHGA
ncbi:hypothetical protein MoryE10_00520 [Methylogaea oryzae]|uniref:Uncharacterized protein n=1 Tax=Methylogaea oryzae TaxID=1295382 RepID=A0A8D5AGQ4_9GAMM|nr:hypothetical protein MoryE10_00520 [Methylogaea oryzae]